MPHIEDEDLISLHNQIEKAETKQLELEEFLEEREKEFDQNNRIKKILSIVSLVLLIACIGAFFFKGEDAVIKQDANQDMAVFSTEMDSLKMQLRQLREDKVNLEEIKTLYLYRKLIDKDTVYSVQLRSFSTNKTSLISEKFTNMRFYSDTSYYKLSLGIFETLQEAQEFRKLLIDLGFSKNIFVISYKNGKRLRIENSVD
ncbi:hypothetical protein ACFSTE_19565 [Aquimarina hainanensis]|uniref:SPOR domain-containing protein n=1 Tax=Aquimarina hainanensis TaxID=1578017 RepID=A0ABW5NBS1_9FLAO|nr:hypothetical protein [Aquimarina sp. TRL1]QKX06480.1 hypothetical protein HN014_16680 [Aquimarina sp. TRL1]